jgi:hypothetical protein
MDTKSSKSSTFLSFPGCKTCFRKPCERLKFGRVYPGKLLFVHRRDLGFGPKDCPFVATAFHEVNQLLRDMSLVDLIRYVNDILYEMSPAEHMQTIMQHYVDGYADFDGRIRFLSALWDNNVLGVIRVPQFFSSDKGLSKWLLANEALDYQLQNDIREDPDDKAAATDSMAAQQAQAAPPPEKKQEITEIEVFVEGKEGPRKVNSNGTLEIVPDLVIGRKITCREVKGVPVTWTMEGYHTDSKNGSEATFQLRGWAKLNHWVWFPNEKPRQARIVAKDKQGKQLQASLNVFSGSKEIIELDFTKMIVWKRFNEIKDKLEELFAGLTGKDIHLEILKGVAAYGANFKESEQEKVFFSYDFAGGFDPFLSAKIKVDFVPKIKFLVKYKDFLECAVYVEGAMALNFHFVKSELKSHRAELKSEPKLEFGFQAGVNWAIQTLKKKIVVIDAKFGALSGLEGALGGFGGNDGLGLTGELSWVGIKAKGYVSAWDGQITYKKEIVLIDPITLISKEKIFFVNDKSSGDGAKE